MWSWTHPRRGGSWAGHEESHGFGDEGRHYDAAGNLRDWWTSADSAHFAEQAERIVRQFDGYIQVDTFHGNGKLTLGENIADNSGLAIAWKAYRISLGGKPAPALDGLTGAQRFFIGWARVWPEKRRDEEKLRMLKIDPHSPGRFRADGAAVNQAAFYDAFGVKPGDRMYLPPERRVSLW